MDSEKYQSSLGGQGSVRTNSPRPYARTNYVRIPSCFLEILARLEKQAQSLEREHPDAAASFREDLEEMFTVNRLGLSPSLMRCFRKT